MALSNRVEMKDSYSKFLHSAGSSSITQIPHTKYVATGTYYQGISFWVRKADALEKLPYHLDFGNGEMLASLGVNSDGHLVCGILASYTTNFKFWDITDIQNPILVRHLVADANKDCRPDFLVVLPNDTLLYGQKGEKNLCLLHNGTHNFFSLEKMAKGELRQLELISPHELLLVTSVGVYYFNVPAVIYACHTNSSLLPIRSHSAKELGIEYIWNATQLSSGELVVSVGSTDSGSKIMICEFYEKPYLRELPKSESITSVNCFIKISNGKLILAGDYAMEIVAAQEFLQHARRKEIQECKKVLVPQLAATAGLDPDTSGLVCEYLGGLNRLYQPADRKPVNISCLSDKSALIFRKN